MGRKSVNTGEEEKTIYTTVLLFLCIIISVLAKRRGKYRSSPT